MRVFKSLLLASWCFCGFFTSCPARALDYEDYPTVKLRTLDKITARTMTFEAKVGTTMKFGEIFIKVQTCRKPPPYQKAEAAAFLQIWQTDAGKDSSDWIFSGWMFASSPVLSGMDHPVYDVWVVDCLGKDPEELPPEDAAPVDAATAANGAIMPPGTAPAVPSSAPLGDKNTPAPVKPAASIPDDAATADDDTDPEESIPTSNLPADAQMAPNQSAAPQPQASPVLPSLQAAPEPQDQKPTFGGIY